MCGRTLKHPFDIRSHILVVVVKIMAIFCIYTTAYCAVALEFAAVIGSGEFRICSCHLFWRIWNLQLSFVLENLEFLAVICSGEFGFYSCHWLWRIWNLQLSLVLENLEFAAVIGSEEVQSCLCPSVAVNGQITSDLPM
jgi:hypothetical protein